MGDMEKRIDALDCLKGIMIIAVVLGHVVSNTDPNFETNFWFKQCYSWHMFCFMAVSGFCAGIKHTNINSQWLFSRAKRLLVPFAIWTFIYLYCASDLSFWSYFIGLTIEPVLWYLTVQFIFEVIYTVSKKFKYELCGIAICGIMICSVYFLGGQCRTFQNLILFYPFYWGGYIWDGIGKLYRRRLRNLNGYCIWGHLCIHLQ